MLPDTTRLAALRALRYAITNIEKALTADVITDYNQTGSDRWRTPFGTVTVAHPKDGVKVDEEAFIAWCVAEHPDEVQMIPKVRSSFQHHIEQLLVVVDGKVVRSDTGELVEWASPSPSKQAYVSITGPERSAAIQSATVLIAARVDELASGIGAIEP